MKRFTQDEIVYIIFSTAIIFALALLTTVQSFNDKISALNPVYQFILLNLGLYLVFFFFVKAIALKKKHLWKGSLAAIITFIAFDLILPEYHVTTQGLVVGGLFGASASDYFFGYIYSLLGFKGTTLIVLVYPVTFMVLFLIGAYLFKDFIKKLQ